MRRIHADVLVVADGHFGRQTCQLAVDHVLEAISDDPPPADLSGDELRHSLLRCGLECRRRIRRRPWLFPVPTSRTTLALALVADDAVQ